MFILIQSKVGGPQKFRKSPIRKFADFFFKRFADLLQMWQFADLRGRPLDNELIRWCSAFVLDISAPFSFSFFPALILHCLFVLFSAHVFSFLLSTIFRRRKVMHHKIRGNSFYIILVFMELCCSFQGCYCSEIAFIRLMLFFKRYFALLQGKLCTDWAYARRRHLNRQRHESELALNK